MYDDRPDDPQSEAHAMGVIDAERNDYTRAFPLCSAYAEAFPDSPRADPCVANYYLGRHEPARAVPYLRHYTERHPTDAGARTALLAAMESAHDYDGLARTLEAWGGAFDGSPEVETAKRDLARHPH